MKSVSPSTTRSARQASLPRLLRGNSNLLIAIVLLGVLILAALLAPVITPYGQNEQNLANVWADPSPDHWFGTDGVGRDQFTRLLYGMRVSLLASAFAVLLAIFLGVPAGLWSGYRSGWLDLVANRVNESVMSVPSLVLALTVIAALGPGLFNAMFAVGIIFTPMLFRVSRAAALEVKQETFVEASIAIGCRPRTVLWRHIAPNAAVPITIQASLLFGYAMLAESSLSFLGLGVTSPASSIGTMLGMARIRPDVGHLLYVPGVALCLLVLGFVLLGDGLRDALSGPRRREA